MSPPSAGAPPDDGSGAASARYASWFWILADFSYFGVFSLWVALSVVFWAGGGLLLLISVRPPVVGAPSFALALVKSALWAAGLMASVALAVFCARHWDRPRRSLPRELGRSALLSLPLLTFAWTIAGLPLDAVARSPLLVVSPRLAAFSSLALLCYGAVLAVRLAREPRLEQADLEGPSDP